MKRILSFYIFLMFAHLLSAQDQLQEVNNVLEDLKSYQYGMPETWKPDLLEAMQAVYENEQLQKKVEPLMLELLLSDASLPAKRAIGKELAVIATSTAEKPLFKLMADQKAAALALEILAIADLGEVEQFKKALKKVDQETRIGIINLVGYRAENEAVELLTNQAKTAEAKETIAIAYALAKTGTPEAAQVLKTIKVPKQELEQATVNYGFNLIQHGYRKEARTIFEQVYQTSNFRPLQVAALNGLYELSDDKVTFIKQQLSQVTADLRTEVIRLVIKLPETYLKGKELLENENLSVQNKKQLITILAQRGDQSIRATVVSLLKNENKPSLRKTALQVMPMVGTADDVALLARLASQLTDEEKQLAENALFTLPGKAVDQKIVQLLKVSNNEIKPVLVKAIGQRNMRMASEELFNLTSTDDNTIKMQTIEAMGKVAGPDDLSNIITILFQSDDRRERRSLEEAIYLVAARNADPSASSVVLTKQLSGSKIAANQISMLSILGQLANPEDYPVMVKYLQHENTEIQSALLRAWEQWPDSQPLAALEKFMETADDPRQHALAMKSYLNIVDINAKMNAEDKLSRLNRASKTAQNVLEKRMVVAGFAKIHEPASLTELMKMMKDMEIKAEVEAAVQEVARRIWENNAWVIEQLEKIIEMSNNEKFIAALEEEIKQRSN